MKWEEYCPGAKLAGCRTSLSPRNRSEREAKITLSHCSLSISKLDREFRVYSRLYQTRKLLPRPDQSNIIYSKAFLWVIPCLWRNVYETCWLACAISRLCLISCSLARMLSHAPQGASRSHCSELSPLPKLPLPSIQLTAPCPTTF